MLEQDSDNMWYQVTRSIYLSSYFITSKWTRMFLYKSYVSAGFCSNNHYKYGQVAGILSLLVTTSTLVLLLITVCDVGKGEEIQVQQVRIIFRHWMDLRFS